MSPAEKDQFWNDFQNHLLATSDEPILRSAPAGDPVTFSPGKPAAELEKELQQNSVVNPPVGAYKTDFAREKLQKAWDESAASLYFRVFSQRHVVIEELKLEFEIVIQWSFGRLRNAGQLQQTVNAVTGQLEYKLPPAPASLSLTPRHLPSGGGLALQLYLPEVMGPIPPGLAYPLFYPAWLSSPLRLAAKNQTTTAIENFPLDHAMLTDTFYWLPAK